MTFTKCNHLHNHHLKNVELFHHFSKLPCVSFWSIPLTPKGNHCSDFHHSNFVLELHINRIILWGLASVIPHNVCETHPRSCVHQWLILFLYQNIPLYGYTTVHSFFLALLVFVKWHLVVFLIWSFYDFKSLFNLYVFNDFTET